MASRKDIKQLIARVEEFGWTATRLRNGHWRIRKADGTYVTTLPSTPSDARGFRNALAELRERGPWPPLPTSPPTRKKE